MVSALSGEFLTTLNNAALVHHTLEINTISRNSFTLQGLSSWILKIEDNKVILNPSYTQEQLVVDFITAINNQKHGVLL